MGLTDKVLHIFKFKKEYKCAAVIPAAGLSVRMGNKNKLLMDLAGKPVLRRTLEAFEDCDQIHAIEVVVRETQIEQTNALLKEWGIKKALPCVAGGNSRCESVYNGLMSLPKEYRYVAIHDGARPLITKSLISETVLKAIKFNAAAPGIPIVDTVKKVSGGYIQETVDRAELVRIQTPQAFDASLIKAALKKAMKTNPENVTDDCSAAEMMGMKIFVVPGEVTNIKITTPDDIKLAEAIIDKNNKQD